MELVSDHREGRTEVSMTYEAKHIEARYGEPMVPESSQPVVSIDIGGGYWTWRSWVRSLSAGLEDMEIPGKLVKSARGTLKNAPPREAVESLARFLDDPARFRLLGDPRAARFGSGDLENAVRAGSGTAFHKAVLAYHLLRALKIEATLVLGASRYHTNLDWRSRNLSQLDAVLIWIPSISENFLWDVDARWVPMGRAGSDLYPSMLVLNPEADSPTRDFPVDTGMVGVNRSLELTLGETGELEGKLTCRYPSLSQGTGLDPWDRGADLERVVERMLPHGVGLSDVAWAVPGPVSMRCTPETPAVLECRITHEAVPAGESGWDVIPFLLPLPGDLGILEDPDREDPMLLNDAYEISEAAFVATGDHAVVRFPEPVSVRNSAGSFQSSWEARPDGMTAVRKLSVHASLIRLQKPGDVAALCRAWREAEGQALRVD